MHGHGALQREANVKSKQRTWFCVKRRIENQRGEGKRRNLIVKNLTESAKKWLQWFDHVKRMTRTRTHTEGH